MPFEITSPRDGTRDPSPKSGRRFTIYGAKGKISERFFAMHVANYFPSELARCVTSQVVKLFWQKRRVYSKQPFFLTDYQDLRP
jgi:hypothetical protein